MANEFRRLLTDKNLAIALVIALLLQYLPLGVLGTLGPLIVVGVTVAPLLR